MDLQIRITTKEEGPEDTVLFLLLWPFNLRRRCEEWRYVCDCHFQSSWTFWHAVSLPQKTLKEFGTRFIIYWWGTNFRGRCRWATAAAIKGTGGVCRSIGGPRGGSLGFKPWVIGDEGWLKLWDLKKWAERQFSRKKLRGGETLKFKK
jgi:hypothetical protein